MLLRSRAAGALASPLRLQWRIGGVPRSRLSSVPAASAASAASAQEQQRGAPDAAALPKPQAPRGHGRQTLDYTALAACVAELQAEWVPSKVEEVVQPDPYTLSLRLRTPLRQGWLHLSWHPTAARACVGPAPPRGAASEAFSFVEVAGAQLRGLVLTGAALPAAWERVAQLSFGVRPGEAPSRLAFCEVQGRLSNLVLADGARTVLAAAHQVGGRQSSLRQVQQGRPYALPPLAGGVPPSAAEPLAAWRANVEAAAALAAAAGGGGGGGGGDGSSGEGGGEGGGSGGGGAGAAAGRQRPTVAGGCVRAYRGVSPSLAAELCAAAGVRTDAEPPALSDADWASLHAAWLAWLERLGGGRFAPRLDGAAGRFSVVGGPGAEFASAHEMVEAYYSRLQASEQHASLHQRLAAAARGALKKARARAAAFRQQLAAAADAPAVQRRADIIIANVYRIEEGASSLEAEDWDTGAAVSIPLDPAKTAVEQAEALYKRARKLRRAVDAVTPLLEAADAEVEYLEQVESEVAQLAVYSEPDDLAALREVRDELVEAKLMPPPPEAGLASKAAAKGRRATKRGRGAAAPGGGGAGFRRFEAPGGCVILVGRNNKQNDVLSHEVANPHDLWMHVRGLPGSHVLLRVEPGRGPPGEADVLCAAALAAWFSKARDSGKADVIVTRAEHVRKLKGGKPGQVLLAREDRVVVVRPHDSLAAAAAAEGGG
ncbi:hypothetical protein Rsub_11027 [Raphidocelis subcapitata]|uniref:NFACT RNA-binding domain-containing protein n=1 Tax=Raphidocelis subcapitata TaxID=307507 RepID=A0A2V0PHI6_9CHLO|nr:hypothetical protein Rsub_11027 [Raphidocelis subcapitata]|eukprot:GBF97380.1 hypothetical protein Rsub_11027 [Raphidocelis subcapitata]